VTRWSVGACVVPLLLFTTACSGGGGKRSSVTTTGVGSTTSITAPSPASGLSRAGATEPLTRPIIAMPGCVLESAGEGSSTLTLFSWPSSKRTVQVLADPKRGVDRPYAIVERFFANTRNRAVRESAVYVNGRPAWVYVGQYSQGAVIWRLADGSVANIRARGFDRKGLVAIARSLRARASTSRIPGFDVARPTPFGLALVGETAGPVRSAGVSSTCTMGAVQVTVSVVRGDAVGRFAGPMDALPLPLLAERDGAVVAIFSPDSDAAIRASHSIRNATPQQWAELLAR
jgi:hypothetical protein